MQLIVLSGLPGTGKSSLAEAISRRFAIPVFSKDWLEATLVRSELVPSNESKTLGYAGYELMSMLAERQLRLRQSAILDSVASTESIRNTWRGLAKMYNARWRVIECIWSDEQAHRTHLEKRQRSISGWHELDWSEVERVKAYYAPWTEDHLVVDAVRPAAQNIEVILKYLE